MLNLSVFETTHAIDTLALVPRADALGYVRFWLTEHRNNTQSASPLLLAGLAARETTRIRLGTAGLKLRYHSALKVAEDAHLLAALTGGRLDLGVLGTREAPAAIHTALLDGRSDAQDVYASKFHELAALLTGNLGNVQVPSLRSHPGPRLWACGKSIKTARMAGTCGAALAYSTAAAHNGPSGGDPTILSIYQDSYVSIAGENPQSTVVCYGACAETESKARTMSRGVSWIDEGRYEFLGNPSQCQEQLQEIADRFGVKELAVFCLGGTLEAKIEAYTLLAEGTINRTAQ